MDNTVGDFIVEAFEAELSDRTGAPVAPSRPGAGDRARKSRLGQLRAGVAAYGHLLEDLLRDPDTDVSAKQVMRRIAGALLPGKLPAHGRVAWC